MRMVKWLVREMKYLNADGLFVVGDIGIDALEVMRPFSNIEIPIYLVLGNDDLNESEILIEDLPQVINMNLKRKNIGGFSLIGIGGNIQYLYSDENKQEDVEKLFKEIELLFKHVNEPTVIISHVPPYGVLDFATKHSEEHVGSKALRKIIYKYQPILCLCGHVHKDGGKREFIGNTEVVNIAAFEDDSVSKSQGRRIAIIDFDYEKRTHKLSFDYLISINMSLEDFIKRYI